MAAIQESPVVEHAKTFNSTLVWSFIGVIVSLFCSIGSVIVMPGLEWKQSNMGTISYGGDGPYPYLHLPDKVWHLYLYSTRIYDRGLLNEQIPFQIGLIRIIIPALSLILFLVFVLIYRRTYRAQF